MQTPHKHAELIKKWADDTSINLQYKAGEKWVNSSSDPLWLPGIEYRMKPKTLCYRVALLSTWADIVNSKKDADMMEHNPNFIKWLTDWIEVEI